MFCGKCGARIDDNAQFCAFCGESAAQFRVVDKMNLPQQATQPNATEQQGKGRKLATAALILGIISIVLSLIFAPFINSIFASMSISMSGEEWLWTLVTIFFYLILKLSGVLIDALASASLFLLPCIVLHFTGLVMAIVTRCKYKEKKRSKPAIFVNVGAILLQLIILAVCIGRNSVIPLT